MDPNTAVTTNVVVALAGFAGLIVLLLFLIAKWKWHVFLALLLPILLFGVLPGVQRNNFIDAFENGFGNTLGKIGIVIVLGSIMAEGLKHTGAVQVITRSMVRLVGASRMPFALTLTGFILGIAIFSDVAYVILNPLVHADAHTMGVGIGTMSIGLIGALQLTHAIVPPTPGPLAAAALVGADIGTTIIFGGIACLVGSVAGWIWGRYLVGPHLRTQPAEELKGDDELLTSSGAGFPSTWASYAPIAVPVGLISANSLATLLLPDGTLAGEILAFIGWPVVALAIGLGLAILNLRSGDRSSETVNVWVKDGLKTSAMILVVTGLGGSLSQILKGTPAVDYVADLFVAYELPTILLPFMLGVPGQHAHRLHDGGRHYRRVTGGAHARDPGTVARGGYAVRGIGFGDHQVCELQLLLGLHVAHRDGGAGGVGGNRGRHVRGGDRLLCGGVGHVGHGPGVRGRRWRALNPEDAQDANTSV